MAARRTARPSRTRTSAGSIERNDERRLRAVIARTEKETSLWLELLRTYRVLIDQMAEQMLRDHNLPLEWFDVLFHLADQPNGRVRQRALRDHLLLSESGISRRLMRIEQAELITRITAGDDKRGVEISLTAKGRALLIEATESHLDLVSELFTARLTRTDLDALSRVLRKLGAVPD
jgi:DNA-binding MarR family transcriptional regulator